MPIILWSQQRHICPCARPLPRPQLLPSASLQRTKMPGSQRRAGLAALWLSMGPSTHWASWQRASTMCRLPTTGMWNSTRCGGGTGVRGDHCQ